MGDYIYIVEMMSYSSFLYIYPENSDGAWDILGAFSTFDKAFKRIQTLSPLVHKSSIYSKYEYIDDSCREFTHYRIKKIIVID